MKSTLLLGTRKGFIAYRFENNQWKIENVSFEGIPVSIAYADPRNGTWWACQDHGHWGVKLQRSKDRGKTWEEVTAPAYPEGEEVKDGVPATTRYMWSMAHGGHNHLSRLWIGTDPGGLFVSEDEGNSFQLVESLWKHPTRKEGWFGGGRDLPGIHSIVVDPRNEDHIHIGISCAGVFETTDAGKSWAICNKGLRADFLPDPATEVGHDPHIVVAAPSNPDALWQQNHCGIFRSTDSGQNWTDISQPGGPAYFGFAIALDEKDAETAWVVPAIDAEYRMAVDRSVCVCRTEDGGKTWTELRNGLPQDEAYDLVYRHALDIHGDRLAFGTTTGNLYLSDDRGDSWECVTHNLPPIYSVRFDAS
jgi:photosystem II stability/assembly factor-like uncharacterized protein